MRAWWVLCMLVLSGPAWGQKPCTKMAHKICKKLGTKAFMCKVYRHISSLSQASQRRCKRLLRRRWQARLSSLSRSEAMLKRMEMLGHRAGAQGRQKVARYKQLWSACTIAKMLKGVSQKPAACKQLASMLGQARSRASVNRLACRQLALLVCRDIGGKSFYCALFSRLRQSKTIKPKKCQLLIDLWSKSQQAFYLKREGALRAMTKMAAKKPALRPKLKQIKQREIMRVYRFLHF